MKSTLFLFYLFAMTLCQSLPPPSLAAESNDPALPIIPSDFKVTRLTGPTLNIPVAEAFHLLFSVVFIRWSQGSSMPQPATIYIKDDTYNWAFDMRLYSRFGMIWRNSNTVAWTAGRILENELDTMERDQDFWPAPKNAYSISSPPDQEIGRVTLLLARRQASAEQASNSSSPLAQLMGNPAGTTNLTLPPGVRGLKIAFSEVEGQTVLRKAVLFLLAEYMYKILFAIDAQRPVSEVIMHEGGHDYLSDDIYGAQLKVSLVLSEAAGKKVKMGDIGQALSLVLAGLSQKTTTWQPFSAGVHFVDDPQFFVIFQIGPDLGKGTINA